MLGRRRSTSEYQPYSRKLRDESQCVFSPFQFQGMVRRISESERASIGKGRKAQTVRIKRACEIFWSIRILANHRVSNLDAFVAGIGDRSKNLVHRGGPFIAQHLPCVSLATDSQHATSFSPDMLFRGQDSRGERPAAAPTA